MPVWDRVEVAEAVSDCEGVPERVPVLDGVCVDDVLGVPLGDGVAVLELLWVCDTVCAGEGVRDCVEVSV